MCRVELGEMGRMLAGELERRANNYHVKSDKHEILAWEAVGVRRMAEQLLGMEECTFDLASSDLFSSWGENLVLDEPELSKKVELFREEFAKCKNT